jgi:hypothetical protein
MTIVKQQGMEVLGVDLSHLSHLRADRCTSLSHVECSLTLSWPDKPFRPRSRVI